jgi:uncharacterized protein (TIGR02145 family)
MSSDIRNKAILKTAGIAIFAAMFCMVGCSDNDDAEEVIIPIVTTFVDARDSTTYKKVQIGKQVWMAENLNYAAENSVCYDDSWSGIDPAKNCAAYGRLYDWNTAMDNVSSSNAVPSGVEGVCPVGWHLPSDAEWTILTDFIGKDVGQQLKSVTFKGYDGGHDGTDDFGFSALDGPMASHWWTATELVSDTDRAWFRDVQNKSNEVTKSHIDKHAFFLSVRCVHD